MGETTETYNTACATDGRLISYERWPVNNVTLDLVVKGGLEKDCLELTNDGFDSYLAVHNGSYKGNGFTMRWEHERFLLVRLEKEDDKLIDAFSKILGQQPLARYVFDDKKPVTFEWESVNPEKRYGQLESDTRKTELIRIH
jgi:hypothetical protein